MYPFYSDMLIDEFNFDFFQHSSTLFCPCPIICTAVMGKPWSGVQCLPLATQTTVSGPCQVMSSSGSIERCSPCMTISRQFHGMGAGGANMSLAELRMIYRDRV